MGLLGSVSRLLFGQIKPETISQAHIGAIFEELLKQIFGLQRGIGAEDDVDSLCGISSHLVTIRRSLMGKEHVVQSFGYLLLTMYSSDPANCDILEEGYHFLSLLILSLPALEGWDSISAVLTTLNYVCQCIDSETEMPIVALCASMSVMVRIALHGENSTVRDRALQQLDATCSSFEAIIRGQPKYAVILVKVGLLKWVLCDALRGSLLEEMMPVYGRIVDFVIAVHKKGPPDVATIKKSGLLLVLHKIFSSSHHESHLPLLLSKQLLTLLEELVTSDPTHLEEVIKNIIRLMDLLIPTRFSTGSRASIKMKVGGCVEKVVCLCECLCRLIKGRHKALTVWNEVQGLQWLIALIGRLEGAFPSSPSSSAIRTATGTVSGTGASSSANSGSGGDIAISVMYPVSSRSASPSASSSLYSPKGSTRDEVRTTATVTSAVDIKAFICTLNALANCIAVDYTVSLSHEKKRKDFEISQEIHRKWNSKLAQAIQATNIFSSIYAEWGLHVVFGILQGCVRQTPNTHSTDSTSADASLQSYEHSVSGKIRVPLVAEIILEMVPGLPSAIGVRFIETLQSIALHSIDG